MRQTGVIPEARIAGDTDAQEVGRVFAAGFCSDPVLTWVFREPDRSAKLTSFFDFLAREALVPLGATYLLPGSCAAWTPPNAPAWPPERAERFSELLNATCTADDLERLAILEAAQDANHPEGPLWYLGVVATVPSAQGRGLGTALLERSIEPVDSSGLPAYLESTNPRNVSLYRRYGFRVTRLIELPEGPALTMMWREAAPTKRRRIQNPGGRATR
jgi:ribosomal protein S18 acetylase RimI-like enzyme